MELDVLRSAPEVGRSKSRLKIAGKIRAHKPMRNFILHYTPIIFVVVFIAIAAICVIGYNSYIAGNQQNLLSFNCYLDSDCSKGYICYNSRACSPSPNQGEICGNQTGDLLCHRICENSTNNNCPPGEKCSELEIQRENIILTKTLCVKG